MAKIHHFDGAPTALELTDKALEVSPNLVEARVFRARLKLELEDFDTAREEAERALEVDPSSLEASSVLAAVDFLRQDSAAFESRKQAILEQSPTHTQLFTLLADAAVQNRLYPAARDFAREAVEIDPRAWRAWGLLGLNQLRLGEIEEGRENLEKAFSGDPYDVWIKNTLDLLDTYSQYRLTKTPRFELFIHSDESDVLAPYVEELAEEAYDVLSERYSYSPPTPIRIEVYPSHADFSVRTVGLAGLGALGVSFGPVVAIDSPSARELGTFNWGTTLWHELAHTFTLGATDNRIPRWLTEGLSVLEELRSERTGWGDEATIDFIQALKDGKLLALEDINNGFVRPEFPAQIGISYFHAPHLRVDRNQSRLRCHGQPAGRLSPGREHEAGLRARARPRAQRVRRALLRPPR